MDGLLQPKLDRYLRIIGQYDNEFAKWTARTKKIIKRSGWGKPGLTWTPGTVDDPFGHDDDDYED